MATKKKPAPAAVQDRPPPYDPAVHVDPAMWVFAEMYCACGGLWRQRDPVSYVEPQVRAWLDRHSGQGCSPTSKATCVTEREARREAAFRAQGRGNEYAPKDHPNLDTTCIRDRPWPVFTDGPTADSAMGG